MDKKEKLYKTVANSAIWNLVMGIVVLVTGITSGRTSADQRSPVDEK